MWIPEEKDHLEELGVNGRIILKWSFKTKDGRLNWFDRVKDRTRWWAVLDRVLKFPSP